MKWRRHAPWRGSRIGLRLLAFNLLVVFVPVVGVLYLGVYEDRLLEAQERGMIQQARLVAAAAGGAPVLEGTTAQAMLDRLGARSDTRIRVFDSRGRLLADSVRAFGSEPDAASRTQYSGEGVRHRILYRIGAALARIRDTLSQLGSGRSDHPHAMPRELGDDVEPELRAALAGRYGAATRSTPGQRSLTLFAALPVRNGVDITGAVVVSQSTFRILQALYDVRLGIFQIVVASLVAAGVMTAIAAATIVKPLAALRGAAVSIADRRRSLTGEFPGSRRRDEIGELARSLEQLTRRLGAHATLLERFAADVAHEFKNPLSGIRAAVETIEQSADPAERQRFLLLMLQDIGRLERLVSSLRELVRLDSQLEHRQSETCDLAGILRSQRERLQAGKGGVTVNLETNPEHCHTLGDCDALAQVFENLLANAGSFAPPGSPIDVRVAADGGVCSVTVADRGPGIPDSHLDRVFDRFFSYRPSESRRDHLGLGLAIARRIVESHGGTIAARNREGGGALFEVRLPGALARHG